MFVFLNQVRRPAKRCHHAAKDFRGTTTRNCLLTSAARFVAIIFDAANDQHLGAKTTA